MAKQLIKGNEALLKGAILAGCRAFYGYPITPANEIAEAAAALPPSRRRRLPPGRERSRGHQHGLRRGLGRRPRHDRRSGPGVSPHEEGISYLAGAELPCVIADITRGGPGLGNIAPEQSDYFQVVKGGGHGCYRTLVLAPASAQEMCDLTFDAFALADRYRNPVIVLADGFIGQMMEPVEFPRQAQLPPPPDWAVRGDAETRPNLITSIYLEPDELEAHINRLDAKYRTHAARKRPLRELHDGRRRTRLRRLRHRLAHPQVRGCAPARQRHPRRPRPPHHALPLPG